MRRVIVAIAFLHAACETCDEPGEPLLEFEVTVDRPTNSGEYMHAAMFNPSGENLDAYAHRMDGASSWSGTLGQCDGLLQQSGQFKIVAWLNSSSLYREEQPGPAELQAADMVDVKCDDEGCFAARVARITIR